MTTVGILGGGQLGRMLAVAGASLGMDVGVLDPDPDAPAARVAAFNIAAAYDDAHAVRALAERCDVVTYEFENVDPAVLENLPVPVHPTVRALEVGQDRVDEKRFLRSLGIATASFEAVERDPEAIAAALARLGGSGILKTRRFGYDGKGQMHLPETSPLDALASVGGGALVLEGLVPFEAELSVVAVRGAHGTAIYDPARNVHEAGILRSSTVPSGLPKRVEREAQAITRRLMEALDYRGAIGVEFFATPDGLLVNEFAPRVHNSGHWTDGAALASQFENHMRAVAGLPLASTERLADARMENLIGTEAHGEAHAKTLGTRVTLYGKRESRAGRKMGHVTHLTSRPSEKLDTDTDLP